MKPHRRGYVSLVSSLGIVLAAVLALSLQIGSVRGDGHVLPKEEVPMPNYQSSSFYINPPSSPTAATYEVTTANVGKADATQNSETWVDFDQQNPDGSWSHIYGRPLSVPPLKAGESVRPRITKELSPGTYRVTTNADSTAAIDESNEYDNGNEMVFVFP